MAIHLRERPHTPAGAPDFARLGWAVAVVAVCLVGLGGGVRLIMEPSPTPSRAAEFAARKKPSRTAATAPAPVPAAPGRSVRMVSTDNMPVASITRPAAGSAPVVIRPSSRAFGDVQRASGPAYQGFKVVAGR